MLWLIDWLIEMVFFFSSHSYLLSNIRSHYPLMIDIHPGWTHKRLRTSSITQLIRDVFWRAWSIRMYIICFVIPPGLRLDFDIRLGIHRYLAQHDQVTPPSPYVFESVSNTKHNSKLTQTRRLDSTQYWVKPPFGCQLESRHVFLWVWIKPLCSIWFGPWVFLLGSSYILQEY